MKFIYFLSLGIFFCAYSFSSEQKDFKSQASPYDLTLLGIGAYGDGISGITVGFADTLYKDLEMNSPWPTPFLNGIPKHLLHIFTNNDPTPGNVLLYTNILYPSPGKKYMELPDSKIKIAFSMVEGYGVPPEWIHTLNHSFDAVVVPDDFLVDVYKNCGVTIPIFVLPICLPLEDLLAMQSNDKIGKPFTFGIAGALHGRKNHEMLLEAFAHSFGNNPDFQLKIHGRIFAETDTTLGYLKNYIQTNNLTNVSIDDQNLSRSEYINFLKSLDCYVFLSRGEGFSITPREALALGIPCILSKNTAHKTICKSGYVKGVRSDANCNVSLIDASNAMQKVWLNYKHYKKLALKARKWVAQYTSKNLHDKYLNLIKPQKIILGDNNEVTDEYLETNSIELYQKYKQLKQL